MLAARQNSFLPPSPPLPFYFGVCCAHKHAPSPILVHPGPERAKPRLLPGR